ncbi:hypothetical protein EDD68_11524 [Melghiribacillus thermohalophilus]|uniref:Uncharacterized protein n=1 Tax=Melghiribacillus thermohalophilus TaxID=1324956 RepID=A0A4R3MUF6_9BACI|nr:hypothetical protein EDD68_11524 [Melghiribacillus thermohalophilus]
MKNHHLKALQVVSKEQGRFEEQSQKNMVHLGQLLVYLIRGLREGILDWPGSAFSNPQSLGPLQDKLVKNIHR